MSQGGFTRTALTIISTKGDLLTYSTVDTRLPVGADGTYLKADSTEPTGLKWAAGGGGGGGDVFVSGTPVNNQIAIWTNSTTVEGDTALTFDTTTDTLTAGILNASSLTASEIVITDSSKNLVSAAVATYPSLTELTYLKGVTSALQTQINAKGVGTVTSVAMTVPTGLTITGSPVTTTGTLAVALDTGYVIPLQSSIDAKANSSGALTQFVGNTAWRVFYSDTAGDITELALGADGTFLKSNGASSAPTFAVPAGSGDVSKVGTPVNNQVGVWTGDGTIEGDTALTFDTTTDTLTSGILNATGLTASEIVLTDASKNLVSAAVVTYPSLTELTYVKGVTSAIQTQLGTKAPSTAPTFATSITGSYLTASEILITDASKNVISAAVVTYPSLTELTYLKGVTSAIQTQLGTKANSAGSLTQFVGNTAWRVFYADSLGDINELALGADGTYLKSTGATSAPIFATPAGSGDVTKVGTPVNNQVGVWTGDGTIEGDTALTFDTTTDTLTSGVLNATGLTASEIVLTDASKNLVSAAVATYPSLTELTYLKGVTSAIQTQIGTKANSAGALTQFIGNGNWKVWYSDGSGDVIELALGAGGTYLKSNGASSAPTFATPAGGMPEFTVQFPGAALRVNTTLAFPSLEYIDLGTVEDYFRAFDQTTEEYVISTFAVPPNLDTAGTVTFEVWGKRASGTGAANVGFTFWHRALADSEAIDGAYTAVDSGALACDTTDGDLDYFTFTASVSTLAWAANDLVTFQFSRDTSVASNLAADYYVWQIRLRIPQA